MNVTIFIYSTLCSIDLDHSSNDIEFFSGAECIPPIGFPHDPVLIFGDNQYPTASTCALQLTLPKKYDRYYDFKAALDLAFICHGGFGLS